MVLILAAVAAVPAAADPLTVTFDDIDASQADIPIVSPYAGLDWTNFTAYSAVPGFDGFDGFNNGIVSGANAAYSGGEIAGPVVAPIVGSITALSGQSFDFLGATFGASYYDNLSLTITGLRAGTALFTRTLSVATTGANFFAFGFTGLDTLTFAATRTAAATDPFSCGAFDCTQFTLDDLSLVINDITDIPVPANVPEPDTVALLLAGLGAIGLCRAALRRRQRP